MSGELMIYIHDSSLELLNTLPSSFVGSIDTELERQNFNNQSEKKYYVVATEFPPTGKKFVGGQWIDMSMQEKIDANIISLETYKQTADYRIETEARAYMDKATTNDGKRVSVYDCLMVLFTMHYNSVPDNDPDKQLRASQGLFVAPSLISGMIDKIAQINAGVYYAKQAIANSSGVIQIDNIKFEHYI